MRTRLLAAVLLFGPLRALGQEASFTPLGDLPGAFVGSCAHGVSDDGLVVVGMGRAELSYEPFRWENGVMASLRPGSESGGVAYGISPDGTVIVGSVEWEAFRWEGGAMAWLPDLPQGTLWRKAFDVSADGSVVVGEARVSPSPPPTPTVPVLWENSTIVQLGGGRGVAEAVTPDGHVVVGWTESAGQAQAARWTGRVHEPLGVPPGFSSSYAYDVSDDGSVVVGSAGSHGFRWTASGGFQLLPPLPGGEVPGPAHSVLGDGRVIVGNARTGVPGVVETFVWTAVRGSRWLQDVLEEDYGLDLAGWRLYQDYHSHGVTPGGTVVVGCGSSPQGESVGWRAVMSPLPITTEPELPVVGLSLTVLPNPARAGDAVGVTLAEPGPIRVVVYDALGRAVAVLHDGPLGAGTHPFTVGALPAGVYVVRAEGVGTVATRRVVFLR